MFKKAFAAALLVLAGASHAADPITFDTDGVAGGAILGATTFDWQPGSAVAYGGNPSGGLQVGDLVTVRYQANLGTITDGTNILFGNGGGSGTGQYFTAVATFQEVVTSVGANGSATFALGPVGGTFQIYHNTIGPANNLTGQGFLAGTSILTGNIFQVVSGSFTIANTTPVLLDQFNGDSLGGQQTVTGSGASDLAIRVTLAGVDTTFFTDLFNGSTIALSFFNTSLITPFKEVDPSTCMLDPNLAAGCQGFTRNLGAVNGALQGARTATTADDLDFQFQADANQSFERVQRVPEPGSMALAGLGLLALAWTARRKVGRS